MKKPIISVVGLGFVGLTLSIVNARHGFKTIGIDINQEKINQLNEGVTDFFEPNLEKYLNQNQTKKNIIFSTNLDLIKNSDIIFITVGTPSMPNGKINLLFLKKAIRQISKVLNNKNKEYTIVIKSTIIPTTTHEHILPYFKNKKIKIIVNPEFLREGNAIHDLEKPHLIVIGEEIDYSSKNLVSYYKQFYKNTPEIIISNYATAELIKYSNNAFLATKISFINSIANICQKLSNTNIDTIAYAIGKDPRIGSYFLNAGPGFGGSCLPKDLSALINFSNSLKSSNSMLKAVKSTNKNQISKIFELIKNLQIKKNTVISVLGVSFKKDTDDIRESVAIEIVKLLLRKGFRIKVHDPLALENFQKLFGGKIHYVHNSIECIKNTDCCLILTEWNEYRHLREKDILKNMNFPNIIDTKRILNPNKFLKCNYRAIGLGI